MPALEAHLQRQVDHSREFFWHRLRWRAVKQFLPRERPFKLLDVGAGAGMVGQYMRDSLPLGEYHFIEPIESLESLLIERHGAARNARTRSAYPDVDVITLLDVLEHQEDDRAFAAGLVAKAAPGTTIVVTVPALQPLWSAWDTLLGHHRRYSRKTLLGVWSDLPVQVVELSYLFPEMLPAAAIRTLRKPVHQGAVDGDAEFPELPALMNKALYGLGTISLGLRKFFPVGTSLILAMRRV